MNLLFSAYLIVADSNFTEDDKSFYPISITALFMNTIYLVDLILNLVVIRIKNFSKVSSHLYWEAFIQVSTLICLILYLDKSTQ